MKTQKLYTAIIFILLIRALAIGQYSPTYTPDERNVLQIGIKGGFNNSDLYDIRGQDFVANPIFGPVFGGFLSIPLGKYLGVQPEILYSGKGYSGSGTLGEEESSVTPIPITVKGNTATTVMPAGNGNSQNYSFVDRMNFIDVPIMLQLKPLPILYILGGPEYSYLISRNYTFTQGVTTETTQQQFANDNLRRNIFGFISGIDLNLSRNLTLGGRVAWDEQDNNGDGTSTLPRYRNFWGQLALGYRF